MAASGREAASWADEVEEESVRDTMHGSLSCISWSFIVMLVVLSLMIVSNDLQDAALLPGFALGPLVVLYFGYWRHLRREIPVDLVVKNFAFGFVPGAIVVMIVEMILTGVFFLLCFSDQLPQWVSKLSEKVQNAEEGVVVTSDEMALNATAGDPQDPLVQIEQSMGIKISRTPGFYFFIFLLAYIVAAGTEETMKYCTPLRFKRCQNSPSPYIYLVCTVASALGFSSVENVGYTFGGAGEGGRPDFAQRVATAYSRAVVAVLAHSVCGGMVGVGLSRRHVLGHQLSYFGVIFPAVLTHGTFDFLQLLLATAPMEETAQAAAVITCDALVLLLACVYLWREVRRLQLHRLREATPMEENDASGTDDEEKLLRNRAREQV